MPRADSADKGQKTIKRNGTGRKPEAESPVPANPVAVTRGIPGRTAQVPLDTLPADSIYKKGVDSISAGNIMIAGEAVGAGGTLVGDSLRVTP